MPTCTGEAVGFCTSIQVSKPAAVHPSARYHVVAGAATPAAQVPQSRSDTREERPGAVVSPARAGAPADRVAATASAMASKNALLRVEGPVALKPVSYTHLRAHETRHD